MRIQQNYVIWIHIITEDFFEDTPGDVKIWFDTSNYDRNDKRPFPANINKRELGFSNMNQERKL